jgi:hypothetical protein
MSRRIGFMVIVVASTIVIGGADARRQHSIDATPFSHAPCSVLSHEPCAPTTCSVFNEGPCIPEVDYPYGENLQLTIVSQPPQQDAAKYIKPDHDLNTIADLFAALRACWTPPHQDEARGGMQMSVRFSFKRSGAMFGAPQVTYATPDVPTEVRKTYLAAITTSLDACTPLSLSDGLGGALAGRPIMIRFVDNRTF